MKDLINYIFYIICVVIIGMWLSACSNPIIDHVCTDGFHGIPKNHVFLKSRYHQDENKDCAKNRDIDSNIMMSPNVVRNYDNIDKGSYVGSTYTVRPGDTLFYIAWIAGYDYHILAKNNNIKINDVLHIGQILYLGNENIQSFHNILEKNVNQNVKKSSGHTLSSFVTISELSPYSSNANNISNFDDCSLHKNNDIMKKMFILNKNFMSSNLSFNKKSVVSDKSNVNDLHIERKDSNISWKWPTKGKVIDYFSTVEGGNKGIDISGSFGQEVVSASYGKVVYAGNALIGYGNLIIIKHDHDFVSTYAHNDKILVREQQNVNIGQKIATMGNSSSNIVKLHFEIRYKGKSVNPLYYLPRN